MKKISIGIKPTSHPGHANLDDWVTDKKADHEPMKRLTIDVPLSLHQQIKSQCALKGQQMADVVRELLERHFNPGYQGRGQGNDVGSN